MNGLTIGCRFDLSSQVSSTDVLTGAVLRIYKSPTVKGSIEKIRIEIHRSITRNDSLIDRSEEHHHHLISYYSPSSHLYYSSSSHLLLYSSSSHLYYSSSSHPYYSSSSHLYYSSSSHLLLLILISPSTTHPHLISYYSSSSHLYYSFSSHLYYSSSSHLLLLILISPSTTHPHLTFYYSTSSHLISYYSSSSHFLLLIILLISFLRLFTLTFPLCLLYAVSVSPHLSLLLSHLPLSNFPVSYPHPNIPSTSPLHAHPLPPRFPPSILFFLLIPIANSLQSFCSSFPMHLHLHPPPPPPILSPYLFLRR